MGSGGGVSSTMDEPTMDEPTTERKSPGTKNWTKPQAVVRKKEVSATRKTIGVIYHFVCMLIFIGINVYDSKVESDCPNPKKFFSGSGSFGGRRKYLTQLNIIALSLFYFMAFINDLMASTVLHKTLTSFNDWLFTTIVWPLSLAVFILFWGIYAIDRELVYPKYLDQYIPYHLNHMWHTIMLPIIFLEIILVFHRHSSFRVSIITIILCSVGYVIWTYIVYVVNGKWPYPFQKNLGMIGFGLFASICISFTGILYWIGRVISFRVWLK